MINSFNYSIERFVDGYQTLWRLTKMLIFYQKWWFMWACKLNDTKSYNGGRYDMMYERQRKPKANNQYFHQDNTWQNMDYRRRNGQCPKYSFRAVFVRIKATPCSKYL